MNFLSSIKNIKKEEEENDCYRAPAVPLGFFSELSPGRSSVYSFGMAFYGRLGDGQQDVDKYVPEKLNCLEHTNVKCVHIESAHTLVLLATGDMLSFGKCHFGQLGLGQMWMEAFSPQLIPLKVRISAIATGTHHSLAVSDEGQVYAWGCGYNGCLGHGDENMRSSPTLVESLTDLHVISVAGGEYHSLATVQLARGDLERHQIYSWGKGHQGQLGNGDFENRNVPHPIGSLQNIKVHKIVAAANFSSALVSCCESCDRYDNLLEKESSVLFTWGSNACGQLGHSTDLSRFTLLPATVHDISSGMLKDGKGEGVHTPVAVAHPDHCGTSMSACCHWTNIASGGHHCLAVDNAGHLFAWGYMLPFTSAAEGGECSCNPSRIVFENLIQQVTSSDENEEDVEVVRVACGTRHSLAFTSAGECFVAGSNSNGQLGLESHHHSQYASFTRLDPELFRGGTVQTGDGGTNSSVLLVDNQV